MKNLSIKFLSIFLIVFLLGLSGTIKAQSAGISSMAVSISVVNEYTQSRDFVLKRQAGMILSPIVPYETIYEGSIGYAYWDYYQGFLVKCITRIPIDSIPLFNDKCRIRFESEGLSEEFTIVKGAGKFISILIKNTGAITITQR